MASESLLELDEDDAEEAWEKLKEAAQLLGYSVVPLSLTKEGDDRFLVGFVVAPEPIIRGRDPVKIQGTNTHVVFRKGDH